MKTEQNQQTNVYDIYTRKFSNNSNVITDPITEQRIKQFANGVVDLNTRLERIAELRKKFGFTQQDNTAAYRAKLTKPQITQHKANTLAKLAHKAKLVATFNNDLVGC